MASEVVGFNLDAFFIHAPLFIILFVLGYKFQSAVARFLTLLLLLAFANLGYTIYALDGSRPETDESVVTGELTLKKKPSVFILVADGYESAESLRLKGLDHLGIGAALSERGFRVYKNAYSNYRPSVPSLRSFFEIDHHTYRAERDWEDLLTGTNKLYSVLKSNDYRTVVAHPSDYLMQGHCNSDLCYPTPGLFGQAGFILAQTIFYRTNFAKPTAVGKGRYNSDFMRIIEQTAQTGSPAVIYSHVDEPGHSPRGCSDPLRVLRTYGERLVEANEWIFRTVDKIESLHDDAVILVLGDHGAMISGSCNWNNPDVTSSESIKDNLGVLMAVKWPSDYDNRYDANIHTLIDLSWYLLQYLSGDGMDESQKPNSDSFLVREKRGPRI